jgi:hypothetical protein
MCIEAIPVAPGRRTPRRRARTIAYDAFAALDPTDKELFLTYLKGSRIGEAHPAL